jgi:5,10-methylene-tetrahydrofolate dehydrogenase/methenyl tetrahydrofolate cyclohydrolase
MRGRELQMELNTRSKQDRIKSLELIPVSESLGSQWYVTTKTKQEREVARRVEERTRHEKMENKEDRMMRLIDQQFELDKQKAPEPE